MSKGDNARRQFLARLGQGTALAATGGLIWAYLLQQQVRAMPYAIRPPGAGDEVEIAAKCIKCGQCVQACPFDTLFLAAVGDRFPIGTPCFIPREIPCYMCPDVPCKNACPTGALEHTLEDIDQARMGLAVIDIENCLSWQGLRCEVCHRECPLQGRAISVEHHPRRISKHAMFVPIVHSTHCTGCGICEKACPTERVAIRVVQADLVQGRIGEHYRLGWKTRTPITQEFIPQREAAVVPPATDEASGLDYLNQGEP